MPRKKGPPRALALPTKTDRRKRGAAAWVLDEAGVRTCLTPQLHARAVELMLKGYWPSRIALLLEVAPATFYGWVERGVSDEPIEPYRSFADALIRAEAQSACDLHDVVRDAAMGRRVVDPKHVPADVRTALWLLERRYGEDWRGAGASALSVLAGVEAARAAELRERVGQLLRSLPPEAVAIGRELGFALEDSLPVVEGTA